MLDLVLPTPISEIDLVVGCLECIQTCTDFPFRTIIMVDGGIRKDLDQLELFLHGYDHQWKLMHNYPQVGINQNLQEGLEECSTRITAIIHPRVRLNDQTWFGKVKQVFDRDPICGVVDTIRDTKSATLHPVRRAHNNPAAPGCGLAVVQTAFAQKTPPKGDAIEYWSRFCMGNGGSAWAVHGVRYTELAPEPHG